ncbi:PilZ domain-containing protein [Candidatus Bipolaricaulota bacterium]|nr:PilZ domain-containing protein [Candidatus Bipolaricaulota bacterium]
MSEVNLDVKLATRDYWRRYLKRAVTLQESRDARRSSKRYPLSISGEITFKAEHRIKRGSIAILDVSAGGVEGLTKEDVPLQADIRIDMAPEGTVFAVLGRVVHSSPTLGGYKLGIELSFADQGDHHRPH